MFAATLTLNLSIMKKSILNLGSALHRAEQKQINGGYNGSCPTLGEWCNVRNGTHCCPGSGLYCHPYTAHSIPGTGVCKNA